MMDLLLAFVIVFIVPFTVIFVYDWLISPKGTTIKDLTHMDFLHEDENEMIVPLQMSLIPGINLLIATLTIVNGICYCISNRKWFKEMDMFITKISENIKNIKIK